MFSGSEEKSEGLATGLIKRSHKGRREARTVSRRPNKDRGSRKREQSAVSRLLEELVR